MNADINALAAANKQRAIVNKYITKSSKRELLPISILSESTQTMRTTNLPPYFWRASMNGCLN